MSCRRNAPNGSAQSAFVAELKGREVAEAIQLMIEYDPEPPYDSGLPDRAAPELVQRVRQNAEQLQRQREIAITGAAQKLLREWRQKIGLSHGWLMAGLGFDPTDP